MRWLVYLLALVCCFLAVTAGADQFDPRSLEKKILQDLFNPEVYDPQFRPYGTNKSHPWGGPVKLRVQVYVRSMYGINDDDMEYQVQLTVRQRWVDDRLKYNDHGGRIDYIRLKNLDRLWMPDLFFANEIKSQTYDLFQQNKLVRLYPTGEVLYSSRLSLQLRSPMNFRNYPFDGQKLEIVMPSYGYTTDDLVVKWYEVDPVQISNRIQLGKFDLENFVNGYCETQTNTGTYGCIKISFLLKRLYAYYQIQVYIPCTMFVIVAWLTFWVDRERVTARSVLALLTLFTLAKLTAHFNNNVPTASYTKAVDVWTGTCLTFTFVALIEYIMVHYMGRRTKRDSTNGITKGDDNIVLNEVGETEKKVHVKTPESPKRNRFCLNIWPLMSTPDGLDLISRIVYPVAFILFNIIYWPVYAYSTEYKL